MKIEEWRPIASCPDFEASSAGRVRNKITRRICKVTIHKRTCYPTVSLRIEGKRGTSFKLVHALICEAFHGPRPPGHIVAHYDGTRTNNRPGNLSWKTPRDNQADRNRHGTMARGETHYNSTLSDADVADIRVVLKNVKWRGLGAQLANIYNVTETTISGIKYNRTRVLPSTYIEPSLDVPNETVLLTKNEGSGWIDGEVWKRIPSEPNYEASSFGRVRRVGSHKAMSPHTNKWNRRHLSVCNGNIVTKKVVARLVCEAFHGPPPTPCHQASHLDGDRLNDAPSNLQWKTPKQNAIDKERHGTLRLSHRHCCTKLSDTAVRQIRNDISKGHRTSDLARRFGVSLAAISHIKYRKNRTRDANYNPL